MSCSCPVKWFRIVLFWISHTCQEQLVTIQTNYECGDGPLTLMILSSAPVAR